MIILTNTTDKIQVILDGAITTNQLKCFVSYRETTSTTITPMRNAILTNGATAVDLVGSPASSTQRVVDFISVYNSDTVNAGVTIRFNDNGTIYELFKTTLSSGEKVEFQEGNGFKVLTNAGSIRTSMNQGNNTISSSLSSVVLGSDQVNSNATANTMQDVTGLSFNVLTNKTYYFKFIINYTSALTTTGSRWSLSGPTGVICYTSEYSLTTTTSTRNATVVGYDLPATANTSSATTTNNNAFIEGIITPTADGTLVARFASEIGSSAITAKAGSIVYYQQLV